MNRREFIKTGIAAGAAMALPYQDLFAQGAPLLQKKIPSSGELIPIIGLGTARRYEEVKTDLEKVPLRETVAKFKELGLRVIDSSSSYGTAEAVVGEIVEGLKIRDSLFLATKVSLRKGVGRDAGLAIIEQSFKRYRTNKIDLIAVHNLLDTQTQLATLARAEAGWTHSLRRYHDVVRQPVRRIRADHEERNPRLHPGRLCAR